jgi:hemoglobin
MEMSMFVPNIRPNEIQPPSREIFAQMGQDNIYKMIADFYHALEQSVIRHMFPKDMQKASEKSAAFFVGLLGGPPLYHQQYGSPMMRGRHLPFSINESARLVWLGCFEQVLEDAETKYQFPPQHLPGFYAFLDGFSKWMVNTADDNEQ